MTKRTLVTAGLVCFFGLLVPFASPLPIAEIVPVGPVAACAQEVGDLDDCFSNCHTYGMFWYERQGYDAGAAEFEWCMEEFCGGMGEGDEGA